MTESFITTLSEHLCNERVEIREELNKILILSKRNDENIKELNIFYDSVYSDELEFINSLVSGKVDSYLSKQFDSISLIRSEQIRCASILLEHFYKLLKVKFLLNSGFQFMRHNHHLDRQYFLSIKMISKNNYQSGV